jgi:hypothetical protein
MTAFRDSLAAEEQVSSPQLRQAEYTPHYVLLHDNRFKRLNGVAWKASRCRLGIFSLSGGESSEVIMIFIVNTRVSTRDFTVCAHLVRKKGTDCP